MGVKALRIGVHSRCRERVHLVARLDGNLFHNVAPAGKSP